MSALKAGDRVVCVDNGQWSSHAAPLIGLETTIVEVGPHEFLGNIYDYKVDCRGAIGEYDFCWLFASAVRKIEPPGEYDGDKAGDWDLCPWRPGKKIELRTLEDMRGAIEYLKRWRDRQEAAHGQG